STRSDRPRRRISRTRTHSEGADSRARYAHKSPGSIPRYWHSGRSARGGTKALPPQVDRDVPVALTHVRDREREGRRARDRTVGEVPVVLLPGKELRVALGVARDLVGVEHGSHPALLVVPRLNVGIGNPRARQVDRATALVDEVRGDENELLSVASVDAPTLKRRDRREHFDALDRERHPGVGHRLAECERVASRSGGGVCLSGHLLWRRRG